MSAATMKDIEAVAVYSYYVDEEYNPEQLYWDSKEYPQPSTSFMEPANYERNPRRSAPTWYGCSGFMWRHSGKMWGLTHGSVMIPFVDNAPRGLKRRLFESQNSDLRRTFDSQIFDRIELDILRDNSKSFPARIVAAWTCPLLAAGIEELKDKSWRFTGVEGELQATLPMIAVFLPLNDVGQCTPAHVIGALMTLLSMMTKSFTRGSPIMLISSPFSGNMVLLPSQIKMRLARAPNRSCNNPKVSKDCSRNPSSLADEDNNTYYTPFLNSWSQGLVSGTSGPNKVIIVTDARTAIGSEGGPLFIGSEGESTGTWWLTGMLLRNLSYWHDECIGYSIAANLRPILLEFLGRKSSLRSLRKANSNGPVESVSSIDCRIQPLQIVLIKCGNHNSSGVPINEELGLILTCSHSVQNHQKGISVTWINSSGSEVKKVNAELIYKTPTGKAYDIAVISVGPGSGLVPIPIAEEPPKIGEKVISVGYSLSIGKGMDNDSKIEYPLLSDGVVAGLSSNNPPGKLQTTCCVQAGCSGGAILRKGDKTLLGVIVCNTAKNPELSTFPHMNFSVPAITIKPFLETYYRTKDPSVLNGINTSDKKVQQMWNFGDPEISRSAKRSKL